VLKELEADKLSFELIVGTLEAECVTLKETDVLGLELGHPEEDDD
jgi:hypothetical protein